MQSIYAYMFSTSAFIIIIINIHNIIIRSILVLNLQHTEEDKSVVSMEPAYSKGCFGLGGANRGWFDLTDSPTT